MYDKLQNMISQVNRIGGYGILLCLSLAIPAWGLGLFFPLIGGPVFGIITGIMIGHLIKDKTRIASGISFVSKKVLQYAVVLLGFGLDLQTVITVGSTSLPLIIVSIGAALTVAYLLGKAMHIPAGTATLVGVGSSICGGSAIAATAPVINARDEEIAQAVSVIFLFNVIAAILFPWLGDGLNFSHAGFALFAGTAINDTSSVTAAASVWDSMHQTGTQVLDHATIVKLTRTLAIIPITLSLSLYQAKKQPRANGFSLKRTFPMFIACFILASLLTTICNYAIERGGLRGEFTDMIQGTFSSLKQLSKFFIIMAMTAIGLNTNIKKLLRSGTKPLLLGLCCWITIILASIGLQKILGFF